MSGSFALRKLLFDRGDEEDVNRRGYHYAGAYAPLLHPVAVLQPASVLPKSGLWFASLCLFSSFMTCLTMKVRNREKWWMGMFAISVVYYNSIKAHKVGNGLLGHQSGFFAAGMGTIGCTARLMAKSGSARQNVGGLSLFVALLWYEIGRYHLWAEHVTEFRRDVTPQRSYDLLGEYVPPTYEVEFLPYRPVL
ncbi:hypothetical protein LPMP_292800 [Leishmania panamensis]|uniref:Uncharacterized protein n=3 Tax=Leishmania guyanensis species complex TaxID=38579 RepID=A0A088SEM8_LEIPA|nr:hypothetical protein LPMP_292800 [Leishmania panamensis]AIO00227.1 hypothetical protein LPMP_292800 [Leishmania panamensis]CCM17389.1 hypothetical protein, conserved [Leishmania guyanensis]